MLTKVVYLFFLRLSQPAANVATVINKQMMYSPPVSGRVNKKINKATPIKQPAANLNI